MPWETERHCYGLNPEWPIWDISDKLLQSFVHDNILVYPLESAKKPEGKAKITKFFESDSRNRVVLYNFVDAIDYIFNVPSGVRILDTNFVCFADYYLSHRIKDFGITEPNYVNDFLCYQRKPNHHRPQVYEALKDRNGIVTLGTQEFDVNSGIDSDGGMSDVDYERNTGNAGPKVRNDMDTLGNIDVWNDSFLILTSETMSYPKGDGDFLTEKTFKPFLGKRPFVTLGASAPYYDNLRRMGYYTFENDFPKWKRNYPVEDHAVELADFLSTMDQRSYYMDNKSKFDHNYENLKSAIDRNEKNFKEYLSHLIA